MRALDKNTQLAEAHHVLVIDDDVRICDLVSRYLQESGFVVLAAHNALEARKMMQHFEFDALVLDVMMPGESGLELTKSLREELDIPILLLTALGEVDDKIEGLEVGADDYLPKPFEPKELVARLNALLRRSGVRHQAQQFFQIGRWRFDPDVGELTDGSDQQSLTDVEVSLLKALAKKPGQAMSREELSNICGFDAGERTIDVQVTRLRRKIEENTKTPRYLQTVRGKGYLLRIGGG